MNEFGQTTNVRRGSAAGASGPARDELLLSNGTRLRLRPLTPDDRDGLLSLFHRLSEESRWRRFMSPKPTLAPRELDYLTDIDHVAHEAFAAVDERDGSLAGVARYVRHAGTECSAELAVEVADELQRRGIGTALCIRVIERAGENGLTVLTATALWSNQPARRLLRRLGFHARRSQGREIELALALDGAVERVS
ncbi:MAG TPA: GNAT family N-acetyltransferase [Solirubrobacteraceae bacterium]|nr:GNAT family N-acetyltransferase [Solirubrobacteraceae bacterium]